MVKIAVILGSVRSKLGESILKYLQSRFSDNEEVTYDWIRLEDFPLEPYHHDEKPLSNPISHLTSGEQKWLDRLKNNDGYVILTPEYDHAIPGVLKNALDYVGPEVDHKPVQMLKMIVLPTPVLLWNANDNFTEAGKLITNADNSDHFEQRLKEAFHEITFYTQLFHNHPFK
ncbi:NADPH-dependent FMN reductase [Lentilactobacillus kefiri]|uniref:NADPH-dependent FMN reductase n=1 Tax=Lentilactobacillus kefiri TaxID=33962 RepID=UPI00345E4BE5